MKIEFELTDEELSAVLKQEVIKFVKANIEEAVRREVRGWTFQQDFSRNVRDTMITKGTKMVEKIMDNYPAMQELAQRTVTNSMAQRVARVQKKIMAAQGQV